MKTIPGQKSDFYPKNLNIISAENIAGFFVFLTFFLIYIKTLCPTVFWWDSGEFIANIAVLGIPHRPGFPIYMLLGKFFSLLPGGSFAFRVNLLSAVFASASLTIFFKSFLEAARLFFPETAKRKGILLFSALFFVLISGFTYTFWIQAVRAEVYSLNILFFSLLLLSAILYLRNRKLKWIYFFCFLSGLGLGNHHLSLLSSLPALLFLIGFGRNRNPAVGSSSVIHRSSWFMQLKSLPWHFLFFLLGLSIYLYLPVRSISHPVLAWGETTSLYSSASSVFAFDTLRHFDFSFLANITARVFQIFTFLSDQLTLACFGLGLMGLLLLFRYHRRILIFLVLLIAGNFAVVIFMTTDFIPTNPDLHGYLIFSVMGFALCGSLAILLILNHWGHVLSAFRYPLMLLFGSLPLILLLRNYPKADLSGNRMAYDYGWSVIADLDPGSILFSDNVNLNFILRELQYVEKLRTDITVIDRGLLSYDWYVGQKRAEWKDMFSGIPENMRGEGVFRKLLERCLESNLPTYMEFTERDSGLVNRLLPSGYVFRVSSAAINRITDQDLARQNAWDVRGPFQIDSKIFQKDWDAQRVFALSFYRLGLFYEWKGMFSRALDEFSRVRKVDPENEELILKTKQLETMQAKPDSLS
jgi:hypothetical protein